MTKYHEGDVCFINNNEYKGGHDFPEGTVVTLEKWDTTSWQCRDESGESWWVNEPCLTLVDHGPTDEEVLALFGVTPRSTMTVVDFLRQLRDDPNMPLNFQADIDQYLFENLGVRDE